MSEQQEIYKAIPKIMAALGPIGKTQRNQAQRFNFRGIDDIYNHVQPLLAKHGVFSVSEVLYRDSREITSGKGTKGVHRVTGYRYTFYASDGSCVKTDVDGEATDWGDKASNKTIAIAHKYAIMQLLAIPTADVEDPDKTGPGDIHSIKVQANPLKVAFNKLNQTVKAHSWSKDNVRHVVNARWGITDPNKMTLDQVNELVEIISTHTFGEIAADLMEDVK